MGRLNCLANSTIHPRTAFHLGVVSLKETKRVHGETAGGNVKVPLQIFDSHRARDFPFQSHLRPEEMVNRFFQFLFRQRSDGMSSRMMRADHPHLSFNAGTPIALAIFLKSGLGRDARSPLYLASLGGFDGRPIKFVGGL